MAGWTEDDLIRSWRALARHESGEEWQFVHLIDIGRVSIEAGCYFPAGREALIASFPRSWQVNPARLPEGKGFDVTLIAAKGVFSERTAIALVRRTEGSPEIFATMVVDVLRTLERTALGTEPGPLDAFLERVREWQMFMARKHRPLSPDAQIGLMGELWMLEILMQSSLGPDGLDCWQGPLKAAQDFHLRGGAIEVKSSAGSGVFLARINSIEQLDSDRAPLFLCAVRFEEHDDGSSLIDMVTRLRMRCMQTGQRHAFDALLLVMGYLDEHSSHYERVLAQREARFFHVEKEMPRLTRATLPAAVRSASYVLDIDSIGTPALSTTDLMQAFGLN